MRKQYFGKFDYSQSPVLYDPPELVETDKVGIVTLDGNIVKWVWYADTKAGILKTYDVLRDGQPHPVNNGYITTERPLGQLVYKPEDFPGREVDCPPDGVLSETLRGKVEIWGPEV